MGLFCFKNLKIKEMWIKLVQYKAFKLYTEFFILNMLYETQNALLKK